MLKHSFELAGFSKLELEKSFAGLSKCIKKRFSFGALRNSFFDQN